MKKLLAMGVVGDWVGDWHRVRGDEQAVIVYPLSFGEMVWIEVEQSKLGEAAQVVPLSLGLNKIDVREWFRYRVVKKCSSDVTAPTLTTVELIANGKAPAQTRHADDSKRTDG